MLPRLLKFGCLLFGAVGLVSCASQESTHRQQYAEARFASFVTAQSMTYFEIDQQSTLSGKALEAEERRIYDAFAPVCLKTYTERMAGAVDHAAKELGKTGDDGLMQRLPQYARMMDEFFSECVSAYGAKGYNFMQTEDGRKLPMPEYIGLAIASGVFMVDARLQVEAEKKQNKALIGGLALAFGAGMSGNQGLRPVNPNQVLVGGYMKMDGTIAKAHWRTVPNFTCLDNINGCR